MTTSPARSFDPAISSIVPSASRRRAVVSDLALRRASACALPRPSAMASAKFAKSTVNQSQSVICKSNFVLPCRCMLSRIKSVVVRTLPTSTTNMTGLRIIATGFNLRKASTAARRAMAAFMTERRDFPELTKLSMYELETLENPADLHQQVLEDRPEAKRRNESECANDKDHAGKKRGKQWRRDGKSARGS